MHSTRPLLPDDADHAAPEVQPGDGAEPPSALEQIRSLAADVVRGLSPLPAAIPIRSDPEITEARSKGSRIASPRPPQAKGRPPAGHGQPGVQARTQAEQTGVSARTSARQPGDSGRADQSLWKDSGTVSLRLRKGWPESLRGLRQGKGRTLQGGEGGCHFPDRRSGVENVRNRTPIEPQNVDRDPLRPREMPRHASATAGQCAAVGQRVSTAHGRC